MHCPTSYFFPLLDSYSEYTKALFGQCSTHAGIWPLSLHKSHLEATLWPRSSLVIAPKGQTRTQVQQPTQRSSAFVTIPVSGSLCIAPTIQALVQGASSQCLHCKAKETGLLYSTRIRLIGGFASFLKVLTRSFLYLEWAAIQ